MNNKKIKSAKKSASVPHLIDERLELLNTIEAMVKKEVDKQFYKSKVNEPNKKESISSVEKPKTEVDKSDIDE